MRDLFSTERPCPTSIYYRPIYTNKAHGLCMSGVRGLCKPPSRPPINLKLGGECLGMEKVQAAPGKRSEPNMAIIGPGDTGRVF